MLGLDYEFTLTDSGLRVGIGIDSRYTSSYYLGETLSPLQRQDDYVDLNSALRLSTPSDGSSVNVKPPEEEPSGKEASW